MLVLTVYHSALIHRYSIWCIPRSSCCKHHPNPGHLVYFLVSSVVFIEVCASN